MNEVEAVLLFHDHKIDTVSFDARKELGLLSAQFPVVNAKWNFNLAFRLPLFAEPIGRYFTGMEVTGTYHGMQHEREYTIAELKVGILGAFSFQADLPENVIAQMLCSNCNAILVPYLRAAISQLVLNAGYGVASLPVINVLSAAEAALMKDGQWPSPRVISNLVEQEQLVFPQ